ncbi:transketolase [Patescibacteria group bacterium]|nr:transketolase [Patescibacteria group bacterium]
MYLDPEKEKMLAETANTIRQDIISMLLAAKSGHSAGPLGMADVFAAFYFDILHHRPQEPEWPERDYFILSNGHICPVQYAAMARAGYFPVEELQTLRKFGSRLQGHPHRGALPGIETTSGPLGEGLGQAIGIALGLRMDGKKNWVYCMMSDGEQDEGSTWEAVLLAGREKLSNLIAVMDRNYIQIDGFTEDVMPLDPLREKYESFGWHVQEIDGHNFGEIISAVEAAKSIYGRPKLILSHNIPGKGVDFMQFDPAWHGKPPKADEAKNALEELRTLGHQITSEHQ